MTDPLSLDVRARWQLTQPRRRLALPARYDPRALPHREAGRSAQDPDRTIHPSREIGV